MAYASKIIEAFGGTRKMAAIIAVPASTVQSWKDAGVIPAKRQQGILDAARGLGKSVTPQDFFDAEPPTEAAQ